MDSRKEGLFSEAPVAKAVLALAVPTVISQLVNVIYNPSRIFSALVDQASSHAVSGKETE